MASKAFDKGMKTRRKVLGDAWVERSIKTMTPFNADFQELITTYCWDAIWNRPGLSHKTRRIVVLSITLALGRWEEFKLHARAALESGDLTQGELKEVLLQSAVYAGVPTANTGFREAREVIEGLSGKKGAKGRR